MTNVAMKPNNNTVNAAIVRIHLTIQVKTGLIHPQSSINDSHLRKELQKRNCFLTVSVPAGQLMQNINYVKKITQDSSHYSQIVYLHFTERETADTLTTPCGDWLVAYTTAIAKSSTDFTCDFVKKNNIYWKRKVMR